MRPEGIAAAQREMRRAKYACQSLVIARRFEQAEDAWEDFLTHANRVFIKLRAACHGQPLDWMWWRKIMDERRDDPLLAYIHHARNSDTHRLEDTGQRIEKGFRSPGSKEKLGRHLRALDVTDKGVLYPVPTYHLDLDILYPSAALLAWLATPTIQDIVDEAASRLR